jgi:hypothetical protein
MIEVFFKTGITEEQMNERTEYFTLVLAPVPPQSFVVIELHGQWDIVLNQTQREAKVWSCQDYEGDAIREYDKRRGVLESKGFVYVKGAGELCLVSPVAATIEPARRAMPRTWERRFIRQPKSTVLIPVAKQPIR